MTNPSTPDTRGEIAVVFRNVTRAQLVRFQEAIFNAVAELDAELDVGSDEFGIVFRVKTTKQPDE